MVIFISYGDTLLHLFGLRLFKGKNVVVAGKQKTLQVFLLKLFEVFHVLFCAMTIQLYIFILLLFLQTTLTWGPYLWFHMLRVATSTLSGIALFNSWVNHKGNIASHKVMLADCESSLGLLLVFSEV